MTSANVRAPLTLSNDAEIKTNRSRMIRVHARIARLWEILLEVGSFS